MESAILINKSTSESFIYFNMQNYFPIISRKLTEAIIPYSKSEAALQIASANGKTCKTLAPHMSPPADNTLQKVLQRKSPINDLDNFILLAT